MSTQIECLLGLVRVLGDDVTVVTDEAKRNSTRWVFNVVQDTARTRVIELELLDHNGRAKETGTCSITITPMDAKSTEARIRAPEPDPPKIILEADNVQAEIEYRVTLDLAHSLVR